MARGRGCCDGQVMSGRTDGKAPPGRGARAWAVPRTTTRLGRVPERCDLGWRWSSGCGPRGGSGGGRPRPTRQVQPGQADVEQLASDSADPPPMSSSVAPRPPMTFNASINLQVDGIGRSAGTCEAQTPRTSCRRSSPSGSWWWWWPSHLPELTMAGEQAAPTRKPTAARGIETPRQTSPDRPRHVGPSAGLLGSSAPPSGWTRRILSLGGHSNDVRPVVSVEW